MSAEATRARSPYRGAATAAMVAGAAFVIAPPLSAAVEPAWILILVGFLALMFAVPGLHRAQGGADGMTGKIGAWMAVAGAGVLVALGVVGLVVEEILDRSFPTWLEPLWMVGFFGMIVGLIVFSIGTARAAVLPRAAAILVIVGLVGAIGLDMATGAFFEENGSTTEWGFYLGVPLFGLGLAWLGYALGWGSYDMGRRERTADRVGAA